MFDYDKDHISGPKEGIASGAQKAVVNIIHASSLFMNQAGEKACLFAGCALPSLVAISVIFGKKTKEEAINPTPDDVIFGAAYMMCCMEMHPKGMIAGYTPMVVDKARQIYKQVTGRDYPLHPYMEGIIKHLCDKADDVPVHLKPFLPH